MADQTLAIDASPRTEARPTVLQIAVLAALAATGTLATNILLPSLPQMAVSLKVSTAAVTSAITVFLAVFAVGQLVVGPVSDRYGRRWPVLIGFAVFFAGSVWCGLATDLPRLLAGLFAMFSAAPRVLIEDLHFSPIQLGLFFAGTVMIVFAAGMLATKLAPRYGLDRSIRWGLVAAVLGSIAILLVSLFRPTFFPFLAGLSVFLLGMGIVNPL